MLESAYIELVYIIMLMKAIKGRSRSMSADAANVSGLCFVTTASKGIFRELLERNAHIVFNLTLQSFI